MFFKNEYGIKPLDLGDTESLQFNFTKGEIEINIDLHKLSKEELKPGNKPGEMRAIIILKHSVSFEVELLFKEMKNEVPENLKSLINTVSFEISTTLKKTLQNLRWVRGLPSSHNLIKNAQLLKWSSDQEKWYIVPRQIFARASLLPAANQIVSADEIKLIHDLVINDVNEPLAHQLFSEAYSQRSENPRSALVIGIAAAETGFKHFVQKVSPETTWLLENLQSPPLVKMLKKYLPQLPVKRRIKNKFAIIPDHISKALNEGIEIRNKIVHGGSTVEIRHETLEGVLKATRDLLYLLDFYSGHEWAKNNLSHNTIGGLISEEKNA